MARRRKTLPKDLEALMEAAAESGDYDPVHQAIERCEVDARGGYAKGTPLMMRSCTPELARWLVDRGVALEAKDVHGKTALHHSARARFRYRLPPQELLAMGADVHTRTNEGLTPLHAAADGKHLEAVKALLGRGAVVDARNERGQTPLEYALQRVSNADLVAMVPVAKALVEAGAERSDTARGFMGQAAERFEFHRDNFAADRVEETAAAMVKLCGLLGVDPPGRRRRHDGVSPIVATTAQWQDQHAELWDLLVPSSGPCATVQGEVIRITGRLSDELYRNGGGNWDRDYRAMLKELERRLGSGKPLDDALMSEVKSLCSELPDRPEACRRLTELATLWVGNNPRPIVFGAPSYSR